MHYFYVVEKFTATIIRIIYVQTLSCSVFFLVFIVVNFSIYMISETNKDNGVYSH